MGGKVCLKCKGKKLLDVVNKLLKASNVLLYYVKWTQVSNLNFHWRWRWWDRIQVTFLNLFYFIQQTFSSSDSSIQSFFFLSPTSLSNDCSPQCQSISFGLTAKYFDNSLSQSYSSPKKETLKMARAQFKRSNWFERCLI